MQKNKSVGCPFSHARLWVCVCVDRCAMFLLLFSFISFTASLSSVLFRSSFWAIFSDSITNFVCINTIIFFYFLVKIVSFFSLSLFLSLHLDFCLCVFFWFSLPDSIVSRFGCQHIQLWLNMEEKRRKQQRKKYEMLILCIKMWVWILR